MLKDFLYFIKSRSLFSPDDKVLIAVSGGKDSVVMAHLFSRAGFNFEIAHCNFNLRGKESDGDEALCKKLAGLMDVPFHSVSFQTLEFATRNGLSVQMAARELRYKWFEDTRIKTGCDWIATAHHRDDEVETFLINTIRGTGIRGLAGIPLKRGRIIRPLLFAGRREIESYVAENDLEYREDSSNIDQKYLRNKVRHRLIPIFESIEPDFGPTLVENMKRIREYLNVFDEEIEEISRRITERTKQGKRFRADQLLKLEPLEFWLYEIFREYGFSRDSTDRLAKAISGQPGKQFISSTHRLLIEREGILLQESKEIEGFPPGTVFYIDDKLHDLNIPVRLKFDYHEDTEVHFMVDPNQAFLDYDKLTFPLSIRNWKEGDTFKPLGMKGTKKLSDFFIDNKIERASKEQAWLLCSDDEIAWVIGHRIDERFKITKDTRRVLKVTRG